jgi:hypothetical protein
MTVWLYRRDARSSGIALQVELHQVDTGGKDSLAIWGAGNSPQVFFLNIASRRIRFRLVAKSFAA